MSMFGPCIFTVYGTILVIFSIFNGKITNLYKLFCILTSLGRVLLIASLMLISFIHSDAT
jgi:hypothetical protein